MQHGCRAADCLWGVLYAATAAQQWSTVTSNVTLLRIQPTLAPFFPQPACIPLLLCVGELAQQPSAAGLAARRCTASACVCSLGVFTCVRWRVWLGILVFYCSVWCSILPACFCHPLVAAAECYMPSLHHPPQCFMIPLLSHCLPCCFVGGHCCMVRLCCSVCHQGNRGTLSQPC
jgi:hypothetical protein